MKVKRSCRLKRILKKD